MVLQVLRQRAPSAPGGVQHIHWIANETDEAKIDVRQALLGFQHQFERRALMQMVRRFLDKNRSEASAKRMPSSKDRSPGVGGDGEVRYVLSQELTQLCFSPARAEGHLTIRQLEL